MVKNAKKENRGFLSGTVCGRFHCSYQIHEKEAAVKSRCENDAKLMEVKYDIYFLSDAFLAVDERSGCAKNKKRPL